MKPTEPDVGKWFLIYVFFFRVYPDLEELVCKVIYSFWCVSI